MYSFDRITDFRMRMQQVSSDWGLISFGRAAGVDEHGHYYISSPLHNFLQSLSEPFSEVHHICFSEPIEKVKTADHLTEVGDWLNIHDDSAFRSSSSAVTKFSSFLSNTKLNIDCENVVTYSFLPGTYEFTLVPFAFPLGDVNVLYYGSKPSVAARSLQNGFILNNVQKIIYMRMQKIYNKYADIIFTRDPRMITQKNGHMYFSNPITDVNFEDFPETTVRELENQDEIRLLFVGQLAERKGLEYLIRAIEQINNQLNKNVSLRIVGDGPKREFLEDLAIQSGVEDKIKFAGYVKDNDKLIQEYTNCDIFVLSSITEGFPRVLNEAIAAGLPIITTAVGGIPKVLKDEKYAILVPRESVDELTDGIKRVITDSDLRNRLVYNTEELNRKMNKNPVEQHLEVIHSKINEHSSPNGRLKM